MGNMLGCLSGNAQLPEVKIEVRSKCCNRYTVVFRTDESKVKEFLSDSIKKYSITDKESNGS